MPLLVTISLVTFELKRCVEVKFKLASTWTHYEVLIGKLLKYKNPSFKKPNQIKSCLCFSKNLLVDLSLTTLVGPDGGGFACDDSPVKKLFASGTNLADESSLLKMSAKPEIFKNTVGIWILNMFWFQMVDSRSDDQCFGIMDLRYWVRFEWSVIIHNCDFQHCL